MATKELQTRIALKYDSYANWTDTSKAGQGANLVLLKGEIGICEVPSGNTAATTAPTVLFKVGDGTNTFENLKWGSALAADVYDWAKAKTVGIETIDSKEYIVFRDASNAEVPNSRVDLSRFALAASVKTTTDAIEADIETIKSVLGLEDTGEGESIAERLAAVEADLVTIKGDAKTEGSIAKAEADANAYTDAREVEILKEVTKAEEAAKADAATKLAAQVATQAAKDEAQDALISANATAIDTEKTDRETADADINKKFGAEYSETNTVADAIADAKKAGTDAATSVATLENGQVKTNKEDIARISAALEKEVTDRETADNGLDGRLTKVEAFFKGAAEDEGEGENLKNALDTLVEIQEYITNDGSAASDMLDAIDNNKKAIDNLKLTVGDDTTGLVKDVKTNAANIESLDGRLDVVEPKVDNLVELTKGFKTEDGTDDKGAIYVAVEAAQQDADDALDAIDTINETIGGTEGIAARLGAVEEVAEGAAADVAALEPRVEQAEKDIEDLKAVVITGDDANDKLRDDITELQGIVLEGANTNAALRTDVNGVTDRVGALETTVGDTTKGLVKQANDNSTKIETIEADYLKEADLFIINCGSSTEVIYTAQ